MSVDNTTKVENFQYHRKFVSFWENDKIENQSIKTSLSEIKPRTEIRQEKL